MVTETVDQRKNYVPSETLLPRLASVTCQFSVTFYLQISYNPKLTELEIDYVNSETEKMAYAAISLLNG